ncbi:hypothetical protein [Altericista sp. CCNU0014]|uniref:hypothetical protein n=1 Tax=Altericista sp. CCNU0014 TaxID=3082949 RepID=UPI0038508324
MKPEDEQILRKILDEARIPNPHEWVEDADNYDLAVLAKAIFLREAWKPILRKSDISWIDESIEDLENRTGRDDLYALRFMPEMPEFLGALKNIKASGVNPADITTVIREFQIGLLEWLMSILEGGHCFEDGLSDCWTLVGLEPDAPTSPPQTFGPLKELIGEFDPDKDSYPVIGSE